MQSVREEAMVRHEPEHKGPGQPDETRSGHEACVVGEEPVVVVDWKGS